MFRGCAIVQGCGGKNDLGRLYTEPLRQPPWPSALFAWTLSRATRDQRMSRCRIAFVSTHHFPLYEDRLARLQALFAVPRVGLANCQPRGSEVPNCIDQQSCEQFSSERAVVDQPHPCRVRCVWVAELETSIADVR